RSWRARPSRKARSAACAGAARNTESRPDMSSPFPPPRPQRFHSDSWNDSSSSGLPEGFLSLGRILNVREDAGMNLVKDEVRPQAPVCGGLHVMAIPRGPFKERAVRAKRGQPKLSALGDQEPFEMRRADTLVGRPFGHRGRIRGDAKGEAAGFVPNLDRLNEG